MPVQVGYSNTEMMLHVEMMLGKTILPGEESMDQTKMKPKNLSYQILICDLPLGPAYTP